MTVSLLTRVRRVAAGFRVGWDLEVVMWREFTERVVRPLFFVVCPYRVAVMPGYEFRRIAAGGDFLEVVICTRVRIGNARGFRFRRTARG